MEGRWKVALRFRANAGKLILGSIGTPLDHLSVKKQEGCGQNFRYSAIPPLPIEKSDIYSL